MTGDALLDRLDKVRKVGHNRWRARCPAHDGKNRSVLSIGETSDGTVLIKCFHGCTAAEVAHAVGLELHDLFPVVDWQGTRTHAAIIRSLDKNQVDWANHPHLSEVRQVPRVDWPALILACEHDLILCKIALAGIARREPINDADSTACQAAATRVYTLIQEARNG